MCEGKTPHHTLVIINFGFSNCRMHYLRNNCAYIPRYSLVYIFDYIYIYIMSLVLILLFFIN